MIIFLFISIKRFSYSSVEHQIADLKQRINYLEQLFNEHQTEYKNFQKNLKLFDLNMIAFQESIERRLIEVTIDDIIIIDVSLFLF